MKLSTARKRKKTTKTMQWLAPAAIAVVLIGGYTTYAAVSSTWPFTSSATDQSTPSQTDESTDAASSGSSSQSSPKKDSSSGDKLRDTPTPAPKKSSDGNTSTVKMSITVASQSNSTFQIRTLIEYIASGGSCTLTMKGPGGVTYSDTSDIYTLPSSTTCKGFDVPMSKLSSGNWTITTSFKDGNITGSATEEVSL